MDLIIYDPAVHGEIVFENFIYKILDTAELQRLRNLKQLGLCYMKFSSATHTRFEHSIGVCYLIQNFLKVLEKNSEAKISDFHRKCVMIAGLLHDVGHGPFSHMWERFVQQTPGQKFEHEDISCKIARNILEKPELKEIFKEYEQQKAIKLIQDLIKGEHTELPKKDKYLAEIVNNQYCELDLDKFDYLQRDAYYVKNVIKLHSDITRWFYSAKIITMEDGNTHIAYNKNSRSSIKNLFDNRAKLHMYCYKSDLVFGAEETLGAIFKEAEEAGFKLEDVKLSEAHKDENLKHIFKNLDDSIFDIILTADNPNLNKVKSKLQNLKIRKFDNDLPKFDKNLIDTGKMYMQKKCQNMKFYIKVNETYSLKNNSTRINNKRRKRKLI